MYRNELLVINKHAVLAICSVTTSVGKSLIFNPITLLSRLTQRACSRISSLKIALSSAVSHRVANSTDATRLHLRSRTPGWLTQKSLILYSHIHAHPHCAHGTYGVLHCLLFCDQTRPNLRLSLVGYHCAIEFPCGVLLFYCCKYPTTYGVRVQYVGPISCPTNNREGNIHSY